MKSKCPHNPVETKGPIGMYHCPECGQMVLAGVPHPPDENDPEVWAELDRMYGDRNETDNN